MKHYRFLDDPALVLFSFTSGSMFLQRQRRSTWLQPRLSELKIVSCLFNTRIFGSEISCGGEVLDKATLKHPPPLVTVAFILRPYAQNHHLFIFRRLNHEFFVLSVLDQKGPCRRLGLWCTWLGGVEPGPMGSCALGSMGTRLGGMGPWAIYSICPWALY